KRSAAMALGQLGKQLAATEEEPVNQVRVALEKSLADPQASVRQNAAWALGRLGAKKGAAALPSLLKVLDDPDPLVRRDAASAMREFGPSARSAVPALLAHFKTDKDVEVRKTALNALVNVVGPENKDVTPDL